MSRANLTGDTGAHYAQVWIAFAVAMSSTTAGIFFLEAPVWVRAFLFLGLYFSVSSTLNLAKSVRDRHESERLTNKLDEANTERVLREVYRAPAA